VTTTAVRTPGPLGVSKNNPRYFSAPSGDGTARAVHLTGSGVTSRETRPAEAVTVGTSGEAGLDSPFESQPSVLYLLRAAE
jgi:hypothetical protein